MPEPFGMSPELEGILREVAADPRATLLRVPRPRDLRRHLQPSQLNPWRTGATTAELELLRVHRSELAFLLRQSCSAQLYRRPRKQLILTRSVTRDRQLRIPKKTELEHRARSLASVTLSGVDWVQDLMAQIVNGVHDQPATLALRAYELDGSDSSACWLGLSLIDAGELERGQQVLVEALPKATSAVMKSYLWENMGLALCTRGSDMEALQAYKKASNSCTERPSPIASWVALSAVLGKDDELGEALSLLNAAVPPNHGWLQEYASTLKSMHRGSQWRYSGLRKSISSALSNGGDNSRRILDALQ